MDDSPLLVKVWGPWACFTRPEMKVERVSYPIMTPSAARGVLEAIFWKPEIAWVVEHSYFSILRNEVNSRASDRSAAAWMKAGHGGYDAATDRAQRHTLALRDVAYVIQARMALRSDVRDNPAKYRDQFRRRVRRGQCYFQPYLGCREFAAAFSDPNDAERPIRRTEDLGLMLLDLEYAPGRAGTGTPRFFEARLENGVLRVPNRLAPAEVA
jgi:CRISPR-associated protein Cas5d